MVQPPSLDALNSALEPVDALRGEQSQLEPWVRESTAALETLHDELSEWQRDLTRQQADLDQREAALTEAESRAASEGRDAASLETRLTQNQGECRQLEEENSEQLQTLNDLERQLVAAQTELRAARKHAEDLADAREAEREREIDEHRLWTGELREMRRLLQRQGEMLVSLGAAVLPDDEDSECARGAAAGDLAAAEGDDACSNSGDSTARAAELRRRSAMRRAQRRPS